MASDESLTDERVRKALPDESSALLDAVKVIDHAGAIAIGETPDGRPFVVVGRSNENAERPEARKVFRLEAALPHAWAFGRTPDPLLVAAGTVIANVLPGVKGLGDALADALLENQVLEVELQGIADNYQRVLADLGPNDEVHCSCCSALRLRIEELEAEVDALNGMDPAKLAAFIDRALDHADHLEGCNLVQCNCGLRGLQAAYRDLMGEEADDADE